MKKLFITIIAIFLTFNMMALDVWDGSAEPWTHGTGVSSDPYLIETAENLAYLAQKVNEGYQAQGMAVFKYTYFLLTDDLDLNNINWTPIGNVNMNMQGYYFAGVFDGWYHNIDHLKIQSNADVCGLFAGLGGEQAPPPGGKTGVIMHLSVTNGNIISTGTGAGGIVGGMAGEAFVYQCSFSGTISVSNSGSYCGAGGIVAAIAENSGINECSFHGSITASNSSFTGAAGAGGIVGIAMDNATVTECYNTGTISGSALILSVAAGIVGATLQENNVSVYSCYNVGTVSAGTKGGIFGMVSPINPTKDEVSINVSNSFYLNTCGGTTNYGTSKTSDEMKTEQFKNQIDMSSHSFTMDNGTNNGYPIHELTSMKLDEASEITAHTARLSADIHQGNGDVARVFFFYAELNSPEEIEVDVATNGFVEITLEDLEPNTMYTFGLDLVFADGTVRSSGPHYFETSDNAGIAEINYSDIQVYPNPTSGFIYIENIEPQLVKIYSIDGKLVKTIENANIIDLRDLTQGMYLIDIDGVMRKIIMSEAK